MRIDSIRIANIRSVDEFAGADLGNVVVLSGPNGSGKSSVLDAIRAFKAAFATAITDFEAGPGTGIQTYSFANVEDDFPSLVPPGDAPGEIELSVALSQDEKRSLGIDRPSLTGTVRISHQGGRLRPSPEGEDSQYLRQLFAAFSHRMHHIPAYRKFNPTEVAGISYSASNIIRRRLRFSDQTAEKFEQFKSDLVMWDHRDLRETAAALREGRALGEGRIGAIQAIFRQFLIDKEFLGVIEPEIAGAYRFPVRTSRCEHEIDYLSGGEKEVLMTLGSLAAQPMGESIILWDEPDIHLHGTLEARLLDFARELGNNGGQVWIATHSPEIVSNVRPPAERLFRLRGGSIGQNIAEEVQRDDEVVKALEDLGASLYVQTVFRKIVWMEGPTDVEILFALAPDIRESAYFLTAGGVSGIDSLTPHLTQLVQRALRHASLIAIRDLDAEGGTQELGESEDARSRTYRWDRRQIENYLLDEESIFEVHRDHSTTRQFDSSADLLSAMKAVADKHREWVIAKLCERRLRDAVARSARFGIEADDIDQSVADASETAISQISTELGETRRKLILSNTRREINERWETEWQSLCPGKLALHEMHVEWVGQSLSYQEYVRQIATRIREAGRTPETMARILEAIRS